MLRKLTKGLGVALFAAAILIMATGSVSAQDGAAIYENNCGSCHASDGTGTGLPNQPDFTDAEFWNSASQERLMTSVTNGVGSMPPFGGLDESQVVAVLEYESDLAGVSFSDIPETADAAGGQGAGDEEQNYTGTIVVVLITLGVLLAVGWLGGRSWS